MNSFPSQVLCLFRSHRYKGALGWQRLAAVLLAFPMGCIAKLPAAETASSISQLRAKAVEEFAETNQAQPQREAALGHGDTLFRLAQVGGCLRADELLLSLRRSHASIFRTEKLEEEQFGARLVAHMRKRPDFACFGVHTPTRSSVAQYALRAEIHSSSSSFHSLQKR